MTFSVIVEKRQRLWEACHPWTQGLSDLFDSTQSELSLQYSLLHRDAKQVESDLVHLSEFERIAYENLGDMRRRAINSRNLKKSDWERLFVALDAARVSLDEELTDIPKLVLQTVRRDRRQVSSWTECYQVGASVRTEDGRLRSLRREVMHAVHNAAKRAAYQIGRVWGMKRQPSTGAE